MSGGMDESGQCRGVRIVDKNSANRTSEELTLLAKATLEMSEGLRRLFRNKYVQTETAFWSKGPILAVPSRPEG